MSLTTWSDRLREFTARWYEVPLREEDGCSKAELQQTQETLGHALPTVLIAWYGLVGRRLRSIQDTPVLLEGLRQSHAPGRVPVWIENQDCWTIETSIDGEDPPVTLDPPREEWSGGSLSEVLLSMLMSDTLVGVWCGRGVGALGAIRKEVVGGYLEESASETDQRVRSMLPAISAPTNPFFDEPWRGDDDLVVRYSGSGWEWMAANSQSLARAYQVLEIDPCAGTYELVLSLDGLDEREARAVQAYDSKVIMSRLARLIGELGHVTQGVSTPPRRHARFHMRTRHPDALLERIRHAFPSELDSKLVIACRPEAIAPFRVLYPDGVDRWFLPW